MLYESSEGGAGVLRRLVDDPRGLPDVAKRALEICHFHPETGDDQEKAPHAREVCEAACYDCLMNYANQPDHAILDRKDIKNFLLGLTRATVLTAPTELTRAEHLERLCRLAGSELERSWLRAMADRGYRLPTKAQEFFESGGTRPDFSYSDHHAVVYIDGPHHDYPERVTRDVTQTERMEDLGYTVIRFGHADDWNAIIVRYPHIFGRPS
jgi:very-short-patch-repair endonuclease